MYLHQKSIDKFDESQIGNLDSRDYNGRCLDKEQRDDINYQLVHKICANIRSTKLAVRFLDTVRDSSHRLNILIVGK